MNKEMYKDKARFVKKLQLFYIRDCGNRETIKRLDYLHDEKAGSEFIYVTYNSGAQKRFSVIGDNEQGMLKDFCKFLDSDEKMYFWLLPNDAAFKSEFLEDE